jgi:hypothetical protein
MVETQSIFRDTARIKYPEAHPVFGAGAFAVISRCPERPFIRLFETAMEAQPEVHKQCGHAFCKMNHQLVQLDAKPPAPRYVKKPHWAKFLND